MNGMKSTVVVAKSVLLIVLAMIVVVAGARPVAAQITAKTFAISPNPAMESCVGDSPTVTVSVTRGRPDDLMIVTGDHFSPNLSFDLFTLQNTNLLSDGTVDPNFKSFGLAWFQTALHADASGHFSATVRTIVFDQLFGFDPDVKLGPTNTFHIGFWFDNPQDAVACGFNVNKPTPFNGRHKAGPLAMISRPDSITQLGPLCTKANGKGGCAP
jgi:hypothetical protein